MFIYLILLYKMYMATLSHLIPETTCKSSEGHKYHPDFSLLAGFPVGLKSKRFVFRILLAHENQGEGTKDFENKPFQVRFNPRGEPASRLPRLVTSSLKFHMYVNTVSTSVNYMIVHNYIP